MNNNTVRFKYLRNTQGTPIACIAYKVMNLFSGAFVYFGISISNPEKYDGTVKKTIKKWNEETKQLQVLGTEEVPRKGMQDYFVKKEARKLALERLEKSPSCVTLFNPTNPVLDVLRFLETQHEISLGQEQKTIISSRVRSAARRARKAIIAASEQKRNDVWSTSRYLLRQVGRKLRQIRSEVLGY
jgi:predicted Zn-dependent peptidase